MRRNTLFPAGALFSPVEPGEGRPGAQRLHQDVHGSAFASAADSECRLFAFGAEVEALTRAVPWTLPHKPVHSPPLVCRLLRLPPVHGALRPGSSRVTSSALGEGAGPNPLCIVVTVPL